MIFFFMKILVFIKLALFVQTKKHRTEFPTATGKRAFCHTRAGSRLFLVAADAAVAVQNFAAACP